MLQGARPVGVDRACDVAFRDDPGHAGAVVADHHRADAVLGQRANRSVTDESRRDGGHKKSPLLVKMLGIFMRGPSMPLDPIVP